MRLWKPQWHRRMRQVPPEMASSTGRWHTHWPDNHCREDGSRFSFKIAWERRASFPATLREDNIAGELWWDGPGAYFSKLQILVAGDLVPYFAHFSIKACSTSSLLSMDRFHGYFMVSGSTVNPLLNVAGRFDWTCELQQEQDIYRKMCEGEHLGWCILRKILKGERLELLVMEEILYHPTCMKPWKYLINISTGAGFLPSTVCFFERNLTLNLGTRKLPKRTLHPRNLT